MSRSDTEVSLREGRHQPVGGVTSSSRSAPEWSSNEEPQGFMALKEVNQHLVERYRTIQKRLSSVERENHSLKKQLHSYSSSDGSLSPRKTIADAVSVGINIQSDPPDDSLVARGTKFTHTPEVVKINKQTPKRFEVSMDQENLVNGTVEKVECNNIPKASPENSLISASESPSVSISRDASELACWKKFACDLIKIAPKQKLLELLSISGKNFEELQKFLSGSHEDDTTRLILADVRQAMESGEWPNQHTDKDHEDEFHPVNASENTKKTLNQSCEDEEMDLYTPSKTEERLESDSQRVMDEDMIEVNLTDILLKVANYVSHTVTFFSETKTQFESEVDVMRAHSKKPSSVRQMTRLSGIREKIATVDVTSPKRTENVKVEDTSPQVIYPPENAIREVLMKDFPRLSVMSDPSMLRHSAAASLQSKPGSYPTLRPHLRSRVSGETYYQSPRDYDMPSQRFLPDGRVPIMPPRVRNFYEQEQEKFEFRENGSFIDIDKIEVRGPPIRTHTGLYGDEESQRRKSTDISNWERNYGSPVRRKLNTESDGRIINRRSAPTFESDPLVRGTVDNYLSQSATIVDARRDHSRPESAFIRQPPIGSSTIQRNCSEGNAKPSGGKNWKCPVCSKEFDPSFSEKQMNDHVNLHFEKDDKKEFAVVDIDHNDFNFPNN